MKCGGEAEAIGESIGFFRVAASDIPLLIEETKARLSGAGRRESYDNILRALVRAGRFFAEDITGIPWTEIDFPEDVAYANNIILTAQSVRNPMINRPIHVVGAGGIGVALAWSLCRAGCSVTVVDADPQKVEHGRREGLTVVGHGTEQASFTLFENWLLPTDALVLLCTKTYNNAAVLAVLPETSRLVPVQNGFDPKLDQRNHAAEGIASFVSECLRDRPVTRITRPGDLHLGARRSVSAAEKNDLAELAHALSPGALFAVQSVDDVRPYKATKLMYNAAISPLAAAAGVDNGELLTDPVAKRLFFGLLRENYTILRHARIPLSKIGPFHPDTVSLILRIPGLPSIMGAFFRRSLRGTYCSMAPDMVTDRTEIDAYNGHLIRLAGGLPCPLNRAAFALVNKIVRDRLIPGRAHLHELEGALKGEPV